MQNTSDSSTQSAANAFNIAARLKSFSHAIAGIRLILVSQHNAWIHLFVAAVVVAMGFVFHISPIQWCALILAIVGVWTAEALNTAMELLCDFASPEFHPLIKNCKDVAAGAVLIASIGAAIVGLIVFVPPAMARMGMG
jgi:diacylglycerol kinase (ATP)